MQEVLQYEASYGGAFWIVIAVAGLIYLYTNLSFASNGNKKSITRGEDIYRNYCGKTIGGAFGLFSSFFCYISFVVMVGGANSTLSQQWGVPNGVGAVILSALVIMTVLFGLNGIIKALSAIGPIIIVCLLAVALYSCAFPTLGFEAGAEKISQNAIEIEQIGGGNPILSGMSYGGFVVLWFASFLAEIGANNNLRKVQIGIFISALFIFGAAALCCIALISNIDILFFCRYTRCSTGKPHFPICWNYLLFCHLYWHIFKCNTASLVRNPAYSITNKKKQADCSSYCGDNWVLYCLFCTLWPLVKCCIWSKRLYRLYPYRYHGLSRPEIIPLE